MEQIQKKLPVIPLRDVCVLPDNVIHFDISRKASAIALELAMSMEQEIFLVMQKDPQIKEPAREDLYEVGTLAKIRQLIKMPGKIIRVLVEGVCRGQIEEIEETDCMWAVFTIQKADIEADAEPDAATLEAMRRQLSEAYTKLQSMQDKGNGVIRHLEEVKDFSHFMDQLAMNLQVSPAKKQQVLACISLQDRYTYIETLLQEEIQVMEIRNELNKEVKKRVEKNQREYVLREQMHYIRKELGEEDTESDAEAFRKKLKKLQADDTVKERIKKEIARYERISMSSSESAVERGYIETLLEMPWDQCSEDNTDIEKAEKILQADHYGLTDVKERILEYLAVRQLAEKGNSPILCLVGPPGIGKTSIARSMARAMHKEYVRICLGGVRDEAEIRGHRKTYVGAMPGRIVTAIKQAGVKNPLILLDEIDKMSRDYKGDTASAMLEVLDSEQNEHFQDHYLELPIDLSEVTFIATANDLQDIDAPLRDRMEIIEIGGYTTNEKLHIAKEHLVKKQLSQHGLLAKQLSFSDKALEKLILAYTREAGVRELERKIGKICRKVAAQLLKKETKAVRITIHNLSEYLGKEKFQPEKRAKKADVGIVRGLAWTSVGGVTLEIEVNEMPGKGEIKLTGQLGDVMKESAMTGISYIRSVSRKYDIPNDYFETHDLHIHIPEGAVPKDGPSAGITMAAAVLSAITHRKIRANLAMTGEITLRGRVLPIGGLKEKLLAAKNAGIENVLIPVDNVKDLEEIEQEIKTGLNITPVTNMEEVLQHSFQKGSKDDY